MADLKFFFSPGSRYSYLALTQVPAIERKFGVAFDWIPTVGGRIRMLRGADPLNGPPQSGQYDWDYRQADAEAWADYYNVAYQEPQGVELDATLLGAASVAAKQLGCVQDFSCELAAEVFARNSWPIDISLCTRVANELGLDADAFAELMKSEETSGQLESNCQRAFELGVFGNPTFFVGEKMFWGQDRLVLVQHALERLAAQSGAVPSP